MFDVKPLTIIWNNDGLLWIDHLEHISVKFESNYSNLHTNTRTHMNLKMLYAK